MKCLLVVDVQEGFITDNTRCLLPKLEKLMCCFDGLIIATKFINRLNSAFVNILGWNKLMCVPETDLLKFVWERANYIVNKHGYSGYTDDVAWLLRCHGCDEVYVAGIDTDCCVLETAVSAFENNIRPIVLADYCASTGGKESHDAGLKVLKRLIGKRNVYYGELNTK